MNALRTNQTLRLALVVAMLLGWVVLSQRCALGQLLKAQQAAAVQHGCCAKSQPQPAEAPQKGGPGAECCQALHALVPDGAKLPDASITASAPLPREWMFAALETMASARTATTCAGPPPDVPGFVELVLHRSLRAQAPPLLA